MRVVVAGQNFFVNGGSDKAMLDHIKLLEDAGNIVAPFCGKHHKNEKSIWSDYFVEASDFDRANFHDVIKYIYNIDAKKKVAKLIKFFSPDIFHCHIYYGKLTGSIIGEVRKSGVPLVQTLHEYKSVCPVSTALMDGAMCYKCSGFNFFGSVRNKCNRDSFVRSSLSYVESTASHMLGSICEFDHFISVSDFLRMEVVKRGVPENKVTTINNFIDVDKYHVGGEKGGYFSYVGRLEVDKGVWIAIDAFSRMEDKKLVIIGMGSQFDEINNFIKLNNIKNINTVGFKSGIELNKLISGSLAVIVPSICFETFGLSIIEAHALGVPVVASRIGGIVEVVEDGFSGYLFEPGSVDELIKSVNKINTNPTVAIEMGLNGRKNVERKFDKRVHYDKLINLYGKLM